MTAWWMIHVDAARSRRLHVGAVVAGNPVIAESSLWVDVAFGFGFVFPFAVFGYALWRQVDPSRMADREATRRSTSERSVIDKLRSVCWWMLVLGGIGFGPVGLSALWEGFGKEEPGQALLVTGLFFVLMGFLVWLRVARCKQTGEFILFCPHCHGGE